MPASGTVRDRLLWWVLAETGMRLGEALGLQHRDWHTGRGDTPFIDVDPCDDPHWPESKAGCPRRVYVSDELDRIDREYLLAVAAVRAGRRPRSGRPGPSASRRPAPSSVLQKRDDPVERPGDRVAGLVGVLEDVEAVPTHSVHR
jgi:integrase